MHKPINKIISWAICAIIFAPIQTYSAPVTPEPGYIPRPDNASQFPNAYNPTIEEQNKQNVGTHDPSATLTLYVKHIEFSGNEVLSTESLDALAKPNLNKDNTLIELMALTKAITKRYQQEGYLLAQAYLPEQDIHDGSIQISIIEGKLDQIRVTGNEHLNIAFFKQIATHNGQFKSGSTVNEQNLVRGVSLLHSLPGINASATLEPGVTLGTTNAGILINEESPVGGFVSGNTYGNRYTSREVLHGHLFFNNPANRGDRLSARLIDSRNERQKSIGLNYQLPIHYSGTMLQMDASQLEYRLGREFRQLGAKGESQQLYVAVDQPFVRNRQYALTGRIAGTFKHISDEIEQFNLDNKRNIHAIDLSLYGNWQDSLFNSYNLLGLNLKMGNVNFKNKVAQILDDATVNTEGQFNKLNLTFTRQQPITDNLSLFINSDIQLTDKNLDAVEKLVIGGINRWRPFAELPTSADQGILLGVELRYTKEKFTFQELMIDNLSPYIFMDFGKGKINQDPLTDNNSVFSKHYGVGLDAGLTKNWEMSLVTSYQSRNIEDILRQSESRLWGQLRFNF